MEPVAIYIRNVEFMTMKDKCLHPRCNNNRIRESFICDEHMELYKQGKFLYKRVDCTTYEELFSEGKITY